MRLIPGKTKVQIELFKGISLWDMLVAGIGALLVLLVLISTLPFKFYIVLVIGLIFVGLLVRMDTVPNYLYLLHILRHFSYSRKYDKVYDDKTLIIMNSENSREQLVEMMTGRKKKRPFAETIQNAEDEDAEDGGENEETPAEPVLDKKALKELIRKENAILHDKKATKEEQDAVWLARAKRSAAKKAARSHSKEKRVERDDMEKIMPFTAIKDGYIEYGGKYYGAVLEIPPVEFRFLSPYRRENSIVNGLGRVLRNLRGEFSANIVKLERPLLYDRYLEKEYQKLDALKSSFENGMLSEEELQARVEILYDRIEELQKLCGQEKVIAPFYYLVIYESDKRQLEVQLGTAIDTLRAGEMECTRLNDRELAVFLKYTNDVDFEEHDVDKIAPEQYAAWAMPQTVDINVRTVEINHIMTHNMRVVSYPSLVDDAWLATVMSMPATKVVVKCRPMEHGKAVRNLDRSLQELRGQLMATNVDSKVIELQNHIQTLGELLAMLQGDNEMLLETNIYVTAYDIAATRANPKIVQPPISLRSNITSMKKMVRRTYQEQGFRLNNMEFDQMQAFIGSQISAWDPLAREGRGIPSNSLAACYPWVFAFVSDEGGMKLGSSDGVPVFIDFFRRDSERINSNMVIIGKSGSGKSYATKDILTNLAADNSKIFILDPENEYTELASNLHGKFINVGNATQGRINPFQIITALDDDGEGEAKDTGSYAAHLQFLEEFFRQILPDCDKDAMEYLNSLIDRMYTNFGITGETDLSKLTPEDYPIFDDLYDAILQEFQQTDNEYVRSILRILMNYIAKFSTGGRNANIWNGPSSITTDENFIVFNFQSLLSNRNNTIANAQMLLVLKYVDNEIIKNRDYNTKYHMNRKIVVAIDEAHVFIDNKFPVALDFMFQLAKRIRKYNGMQIVITQNIKDFVGSEEIARKSTAIINACQYSFIFALAPNDMQDLCTLYEKAGGINESEQEQITSAPRGQAFTIMGASSRTSFRVEVPEDVVDMFQSPDFESRYFTGEQGEEYWEDFVGDSREIALESKRSRITEEKPEEEQKPKKHVTFTELTEEEAEAEELEQLRREMQQEQAKQNMKKPTVVFEEVAAEPEPIGTQQTAAADTQTADSDTITAPGNSEAVSDSVSSQAAATVTTAATTASQLHTMAASATGAMAQTGAMAIEQMLTQILQKFSYDSMTSEIRRAVKEQVEKELVARGIDPDAPIANFAGRAGKEEQPTEIITEEPITEEKQDESAEAFVTSERPEETQDFTESGSYGNAEEEEPYDDFFGGDADFAGFLADDDEEASTEDDDFNLMELLQKQAKQMESVTPIDTMDAYGDEVVDITLEDLVKYIQKNIYHM